MGDSQWGPLGILRLVSAARKRVGTSSSHTTGKNHGFPSTVHVRPPVILGCKISGVLSPVYRGNPEYVSVSWWRWW